ncbi:nuclear apoptosis-inducing factor 1-like [Lineus longissimus]|uniref:nuclear apoptosis-inducing factor 1-like n=1 Tax=Lineus longissimus TaxID=88925 RepID=UPI00315D40E1
MTEEKGPRKTNFTQREIERLVNLVAANFKTISNKFGDAITHKAKTDTWMGIADKVIAISPCHRSLRGVQKKWADLKLQAKKKAAKLRKRFQATGNLSSDNGDDDDDDDVTHLTEIEERIVGLLGIDTVIPKRVKTPSASTTSICQDPYDSPPIRSPSPPLRPAGSPTLPSPWGGCNL